MILLHENHTDGIFGNLVVRKVQRIPVLIHTSQFTQLIFQDPRLPLKNFKFGTYCMYLVDNYAVQFDRGVSDLSKGPIIHSIGLTKKLRQ